jgi:HEAT repeat protein
MRVIAIVPLLLAALPGLGLGGDSSPAVKALLDKVTSDRMEVRAAARSEAASVGAAAVEPLAALIDETRDGGGADRQRREVALTARGALERIVHQAGREGAAEERRTTAAALARALGAARTAREKRELLHLMAFIGGDPEAPAAAKLLGDEDRQVREAARLALERIPGEGALAALVAAAKGAADDRRPDLIFSIGKKGNGAAAAFLVDAARSGSGQARVAAFEALSRLGAPAASAAFRETLARPDLPERAAIVNEYLRWADRTLASGAAGAEEAHKAYGLVLSSAPLENQRERALLQLAAKPFASMDALLAGLADPGERVRRAAITMLLAMEGSEAVHALAKAYADGKPEARPAILRALAGKDAAAAEPLLRDASASTSAELKITALDIRGALADPGMESTYLQAAREGSSAIRPVAVRGYLAVARRRLDAGEKDAAFGMFGRALEVATGAGDRGDALQGLLAAGDTKAIDQVAGLLKDPFIGAEASRGYVDLAAKIGAAGDKERAEKVLVEVVKGDFAGDLRTRALDELRKLGRDPQALIRAQGFVVDWWVVGAMEDRDGKGFEKKFFPEEVIDLTKEQTIGPRRYRWKKLDSLSLDGRIQLVPVFRRSENAIAYAYAEIQSPAAREVRFKMGSDDGIACWLNGERIHLADVRRSLTVDQDTAPAKLVAGSNRILLKVKNFDGDWGFAFRITDAEGKAVDVSK